MDCEELLLKAHLLSRGFDADRLRVVLGSGVATFYLWGFDGRLRGYQHYKPHAEKNCKNPKDARYFTRTTRPCLWGLEYLPESGGGICYRKHIQSCSLDELRVQCRKRTGVKYTSRLTAANVTFAV